MLRIAGREPAVYGAHPEYVASSFEAAGAGTFLAPATSLTDLPFRF